ncbi:hypothetical protein ACFQX7_34105 [Luedemannella flava]
MAAGNSTGQVLRTAGRAALAYAGLYLLTFVANSVASTMVASYAEEYPTPAQLRDQLPISATLAVAFVAVGTFGIVAMTGIATYVGRAGSTLAPGLRALAAAAGVRCSGTGSSRCSSPTGSRLWSGLTAGARTSPPGSPACSPRPGS